MRSFWPLLIFSLIGSPAFAAQGPYPLLKDTPAYVCEQMLLGAQYGKPANAHGFNFFRKLMGTRYDTQVKGFQEVLAKGREGIIFLPNHTGPIDPMVVVAAIGGDTHVRPVMTEEMAKGPSSSLMKRLVGGVNALLLPSPSVGGKTGTSLAQAVLKEVGNALNNGDNILLYPSGTVQLSSKENVTNKSAIEQLLKLSPNMRIVLVRERGLWGSTWSHGGPGATDKRVGTGTVIQRGLIAGLATLLGNGFVLAPKRPVTLEFFEPTDFPRNGTRDEMNAYMERFYNNEQNPEKRTFVRRYFWQFWKKKIEIAETDVDYTKPMKGHSQQVEVNLPPLNEETGKKLLGLAKSIFTSENLNLDSDLVEEGLDSMNTVEVLTAISETFDVNLPDDTQFATLRDLGHLIQAKTQGTNEVEEQAKASAGWLANPSSDKFVQLPENSSSVTEMIVKKALSEPDKVIGEDQIRGPLTYKKLLIQSLAVASALKKIEGPRLGLLLPASAGGSLMYTATHLSGKVPVYVNFTSSPEAIVKSLDSIGVKKIVTSRKVFEKLAKDYDMSTYMERFVFIEDLATSIKAAIPFAFIQYKYPKMIFSQIKKNPTRHAVILFTSGSSGSPKAVGLSHKNILTNVKDLMSIFSIKQSDRLLSFLPPFHSFGHLTQVLSLALGVPAIYHPKPTDAATLANLIEQYNPTIVAGTPSFMEAIALKAKGDQLDSIRLIFTGAEALKPHQMKLFDEKFMNAEVLEGYGATELSPVIAVNPPGRAKPGTVGKILPSLRYQIVDPKTMELVPQGQSGILVVSGDSVFEEYLNAASEKAFITMPNGYKYYITGDMVKEDREGYITILGRLGRFRKIKGEMISLPAIENALSDLVEPLRPKTEDGSAYAGPLIAVESADDNQPLVLYSSVDLTVERVQKFMREKGLTGAHAISEVRRVPEIPMLGTGKADYKQLQDLLRKEAGI